MTGVYCQFGGSAYDALKPRERRDYDLVKAAVLADGGFSAFDASATPTSARLFGQLYSDRDVVIGTSSSYPWVEAKPAQGAMRK